MILSRAPRRAHCADRDVHIPEAHFKVPLAHDVPSSKWISGGHAVDVPLQYSGRSHVDIGARQSVPDAEREQFLQQA